MNSLTDVLEYISAADQEILEKQAEEKLAAEEEDAAGRIMARGFADELNKIAVSFKPAGWDSMPERGSYEAPTMFKSPGGALGYAKALGRQALGMPAQAPAGGGPSKTLGTISGAARGLGQGLAAGGKALHMASDAAPTAMALGKGLGAAAGGAATAGKRVAEFSGAGKKPHRAPVAKPEAKPAPDMKAEMGGSPNAKAGGGFANPPGKNAPSLAGAKAGPGALAGLKNTPNANTMANAKPLMGPPKPAGGSALANAKASDKNKMGA